MPLGGMKTALDPLPVHLSRAATSEQFNALARTIDQQMTDLARRQQDWRSAWDREAAELRDKMSGLDRTFQGLLRAWTSLRIGTSGLRAWSV